MEGGFPGKDGTWPLPLMPSTGGPKPPMSRLKGPPSVLLDPSIGIETSGEDQEGASPGERRTDSGRPVGVGGTGDQLVPCPDHADRVRTTGLRKPIDGVMSRVCGGALSALISAYHGWHFSFETSLVSKAVTALLTPGACQHFGGRTFLADAIVLCHWSSS